MRDSRTRSPPETVHAERLTVEVDSGAPHLLCAAPAPHQMIVSAVDVMSWVHRYVLYILQQLMASCMDGPYLKMTCRQARKLLLYVFLPALPAHCCKSCCKSLIS